MLGTRVVGQKVIDERHVQLKNDRGAMLVIVLDITTRAKETHPLKMSLPM